VLEYLEFVDDVVDELGSREENKTTSTKFWKMAPERIVSCGYFATPVI